MNFVFDGRPSESPLVEKIWYTQSEGSGSFTSLAASQCEMVVTKKGGRTMFTVRGPETKATAAHVTGDMEAFGIVFKLGTFMPHLPASMLLDRNDVTLPEATNQSFWLLGSAWQIPTFENVDTFVERLARQNLLVHDTLIDDVMRDYVPDLSERTVRRRFLQATGLTHGEIRQIERARHAARLLRDGASILDTVFEAGYFDQPHLTRSMKRFIGQTPTQVATASLSVLYNT